jgi:hypothetical protein
LEDARAKRLRLRRTGVHGYDGEVFGPDRHGHTNTPVVFEATSEPRDDGKLLACAGVVYNLQDAVRERASGGAGLL